MDRGAGWAIVHGVSRIWTQLSMHTHVITRALWSGSWLSNTSLETRWEALREFFHLDMPQFSQVLTEWDMPALRGMWALKEIIFWKLLAQAWLIVLTKQMETALITSVISADVATSWIIIASTSSAQHCDSWNDLRDSRRDSSTPKMGNRDQMYLAKAALPWLHSFLFIPCLRSHVYASSLVSYLSTTLPIKVSYLWVC